MEMDLAVTITQCGISENVAVLEGDCDDDNKDVNPNALEMCDKLDNDCDNEVDEESVNAFTYFPDDDGDGYGSNDLTLSVDSCSIINGYVENSLDCNDSGDDDDEYGVIDGVLFMNPERLMRFVMNRQQS